MPYWAEKPQQYSLFYFWDTCGIEPQEEIKWDKQSQLKLFRMLNYSGGEKSPVHILRD